MKTPKDKSKMTADELRHWQDVITREKNKAVRAWLCKQTGLLPLSYDEET